MMWLTCNQGGDCTPTERTAVFDHFHHHIFFIMFCWQWKLQRNLSTRGTISSIAKWEPLSWLVMVVKLDWLMVVCVFLITSQNCVQLCLSSLPNNKANPNADIVPFALVPYTEYRVYFPKLKWAAFACNTPCRNRNCSFDVDGKVKIPVKNLNWGPSSNPKASHRKVSLSLFQLFT